MFRKKVIIIVCAAIITAGAVGGFLFFWTTKENLDLELSLLEKSFVPGQEIKLQAAIRTAALRSSHVLVNAHIVGNGLDYVLQTYFPTIEPHQEYPFNFQWKIPAQISLGAYRIVVRVMNYGASDTIQDIISSERTFVIKPLKPLTEKDIAIRKVVASGKGITMQGDLMLYPIEIEGSMYGKTVTIAGICHNVTYWDGEYKLVVTVVDPLKSKREFSEKLSIKSNSEKNFSFEYPIARDMPEGRYAITCNLFDDRQTSKQYGTMINETVNSFSVIDTKPVLNLDEVALQVPGNGPYEFKVKALDDRGIKRVMFTYDFERKGVLSSIPLVGKKRGSEEMPMTLLSGDALNGVWGCTIMMPSQGSKFVFCIEAEDTNKQKVLTEQYPVAVVKPVKKEKEKKEDINMQNLPGIQGYENWEY